MDALKVLMVDDEPGMRTGVARALAGFTVPVPELDEVVRFEVDQAESGEQALEMAAESRPDLMLLDHKLPGISGLDVLHRYHSESDETLIIMITAYASLETAVSATKSGAYDFLAKPFTPGELKSTVAKAARHLVLQRQARKLAEEKRQVRFQFISVLSHELKAPLGAIEGYLRIVRDRTAGDDRAAYDHMIDRSLIRLEGMRKLIFDLLDLTRIESGQKQRQFADVDVCEVARAAIETTVSQAAEHRIEVALNADGPCIMAGDRGELEIILNNLVSNAVKYNRDAGRVTVAVGGDDDTVALSVSDTGIGMSAEEAGRLFNDFVRIKNDKTRKILGSGLGLSTVRKLAKLYGGDVTVHSEPDVGSTFTVRLKRHGNPDVIEREVAAVPHGRQRAPVVGLGGSHVEKC